MYGSRVFYSTQHILADSVADPKLLMRADGRDYSRHAERSIPMEGIQTFSERRDTSGARAVYAVSERNLAEEEDQIGP